MKYELRRAFILWALLSTSSGVGVLSPLPPLMIDGYWTPANGNDRRPHLVAAPVCAGILQRSCLARRRSAGHHNRPALVARHIASSSRIFSFIWIHSPTWIVVIEALLATKGDVQQLHDSRNNLHNSPYYVMITRVTRAIERLDAMRLTDLS